MIYQQLFDRTPDRTVRAGLIGGGHFGTAVIAQARAMPRLALAAVADRDLEAARLACRRAGIEAGNVVVCDSRAGALRALEASQTVIVEDAMLLMDLPLEVIVEASGVPEAGARHAHAAIRHGKHVAMITKETDSVIGPILAHLAHRAGVVYTPVDGDQHGLLIGLVAWARELGLEVLCGGKARDAEFVYDAAAGTVSCRRVAAPVADEHRWALACLPAEEQGRLAEARRRAFAGLPQAGGYDLCELAIAANATGLLPDRPALHHPAVYTREIPAALCPAAEGGLLQRRGAIEVATCLRTPAEAGLGGGVFVVVACANAYARMILTTKGLLANPRGSAALIYRPYHLCGVETPLSVLCAGLLGVSTGGGARPLVDVVATTRRALPAGAIVGGDHSPDLEAALLPAAPVAADRPLPLHMASGHRLTGDVPAGARITREMVIPPADSLLWSLRARQDAHFLREGLPSAGDPGRQR